MPGRASGLGENFSGMEHGEKSGAQKKNRKNLSLLEKLLKN